MEEVEESKIEEQEADQTDKTKEKPKLKIHWFDWIAFVNMGLFFIMFTFLPQIEKYEEYLADKYLGNDMFFISGLIFMMSIVISIIIFMTFCLKNNEILRTTRFVIFINKKPLIAQLYIIGIMFSYVLVVKFLNLLFESIF